MIEQITKEYKEKQSIFRKMFNLPCKEIKQIIKKILNDHQIKFDIKKAFVTKTSQNDRPESITLEFYDQVKISFMGIYFKPECKFKYLITKLYNDFLEEET